MTTQKSIPRYTSCAVIMLVVFSLLAGCHTQAPVAYVAAPRQLNIVQRHPTVSSLAAGYAAYKAAKITGQNREAAGGNKNFAQRHPFLTGAAAAVLTHHVIKRSIH
jgi:hypothetical protein